MKYIITVFLLFTGINDPITKIADANNLKRAAKVAYENENYEQAVKSYVQLIDSLQVDDQVAKMNLANAAYLLAYGGAELGKLNSLPESVESMDSTALQSTKNDIQYDKIANANYVELTEAKEKYLASNAYNQLGVISVKKGEQSQKEQKAFMEQALSQFKQALIKNSGNENARYNYELLKKYLKQQEEQENQDQKDQDKNEDQKEQEKKDQEQQDQENKDQQEQDEQKKDQEQEKKENSEEKKDKDGEKKDQQPQEQEQGEQEEDPLEKLKEKLEEMNIPLEKAKMILEAMKNQEIQYVQQMKRKASKPQKSSEKDW